MTHPPHGHPIARACHLATLALGLIAWIAPAARAAEMWRPDHPLRRIKTEKLTYRVQAWAGSRSLAVTLGTAAFTLSRQTHHGEPCLVVKAHASGGVPRIYPYEATITAILRQTDLRQLISDQQRIKRSYNRRMVRFRDGGADYLKHTHCFAPTLCHNPRHMVPGPNGKPVHCTDCKNPDHYVWSLRKRHHFPGRLHGFIGATYLARGLPLAIGGPAHAFRVVQVRYLWELTVRAVKEETVTVPAGTIRCLKIAITQTPLNDEARRSAGSFEGPFGLHGDIHLYVDKLAKHPVLVRGKVKLGSTFDIAVALTHRSVEPLPKAPATP